MKKIKILSLSIAILGGSVLGWPFLKSQVLAEPSYHIESLAGWKHAAEKNQSPQGRDFKASLLKDSAQEVFLVEGYLPPHDEQFTTLVRSFKPEPGLKRLRLSAEIKTQFQAGWAGLWMRIDTPEKSGLHFDNMSNRPIQGQTPWTPYQVVLDVPAQTENISLGFLSDGQGQAWIRNLKYEAVNQTVPVTDLKQNKTAPQNLGLD